MKDIVPDWALHYAGPVNLMQILATRAVLHDTEIMTLHMITGQPADELSERFCEWHKTSPLSPEAAYRHCIYLALADRPLPWEKQ